MYHFHNRSPWNTKGYTISKAYQPIIKSFADEAAKEAQEAEEAKESGKKTPAPVVKTTNKQSRDASVY